MDNGGRKLKKYLSNSNPRDLIREVKCRPGLYDKDKLEQPRKEHKQQLWLEVAESLTAPEVWESYKEDDKEAKGKREHKLKYIINNHYI